MMEEIMLCYIETGILTVKTQAATHAKKLSIVNCQLSIISLSLPPEKKRQLWKA